MKPGTFLRIAQAILLLALLRHLALALFVHPYADDFSYAVSGMSTPLFDGLVREFTSWNGRYASNLLVLRGPLVLGLDPGLMLYRAVAIGLILFTGFAAFRLARAVLPLVGQQVSATIGLVFLLLYLHVMPDASEGFYWYTGAVTYQLANALSFLFLANWIHAWRDASRITATWYLTQVVLLVWMAGSNEVHMAYLVIGHAVVLLVVWKRNAAVHRAALVLFGTAVLAGLLVALAPGNATREALFPLRHDVIRTLTYSLAQTGRWSFKWAMPLILPSVLFLYFFRKGEEMGFIPREGLRWNKWAALSLPFVCLFVSMVVTYWPTGLLGQYRTLNMACFYFMPTWFSALAVWDRAYLRKWLPTPAAVSRPWRALIVVVACSLLLFSGRDGMVTSELLGGRMARYDLDMMQRYTTMRQAAEQGGQGEQQVVLDPVTYPRCLVILPLQADENYWMNRSFADYFGVSAVLVSPSPAPPAP